MIFVEAVYPPARKNQEPKFERIEVTIGTTNSQQTQDCPIKYMRVSEIEHLKRLLHEAFEAGYSQGVLSERSEAWRRD
jgi:hypothetical protein